VLEMPPGPRMRCAIAPHRLKHPNRILNNPHLFKLALLINSEIRIGAPMCTDCYESLKKLYLMKMTNARKHRKRREASKNSISETSDIVMEPSANIICEAIGSQEMSLAEPPSNLSIVTPPQTSRMPTITVSSPSQGSSNSKDDRAISNTAANTSYDSDDDGPNSNLSLNAVNGTRLPHIQPIPKRRQFYTGNKKAMDIYLAGTTGG
ncbi:hypothetical protein KR038_004689, partial [Drosophila bunnanda]